ncbi:DUF1772 domain-containing protein [Actinomadura viridis]|uniref:anthrone oxygenase family protein n=1 Tax=Actinomadura viridis TaxID=58110 RepID=UPI0036B1B6D8
MRSALAAAAAMIAVLLTGGMAGIFFAFSNSVMPGLNAIKAEQAIAAMQSMNQKILNPLFMLHFMGAPLFAALAGGALLLVGQRSAAVLFFVAAGLYVLGAFLPTVVVNVPMNNALDGAGVPAGAAEAARIWAGHAPRWTAWNNLRAVASSLSLLAMGIGLYVWGTNT